MHLTLLATPMHYWSVLSHYQHLAMKPMVFIIMYRATMQSSGVWVWLIMVLSQSILVWFWSAVASCGKFSVMLHCHIFTLAMWNGILVSTVLLQLGGWTHPARCFTNEPWDVVCSQPAGCVVWFLLRTSTSVGSWWEYWLIDVLIENTHHKKHSSGTWIIHMLLKPTWNVVMIPFIL